MFQKRPLRFLCFIFLAAFLFSIPAAGACRAAKKKGKSSGKYILVPILMYHQVKPFKVSKDVITPYELESDLKSLRQHGYSTITMTELIDYERGKSKKLPPKPVIMSFDDGYYNNYVYAYPLFKKYDMKMVLSIIGKDTDDFSRVEDVNISYSHVTWDEIREMMHSGNVEIQNHTYDMHRISRGRFGCGKSWGESDGHYEKVLLGDIGGLQKEITSLTGWTPNTFTYPYGQVCGASFPIIKKLGFSASLSCKYGINIITGNPDELYGLMRICRAHGTSAVKSIDKAMETLKYRKLSLQRR